MPFLSFAARSSNRRAFALSIVFGLLAGSCFAQPLFLTVRATPYDRQMARVNPTLTTRGPSQGFPVSVMLPQWMTELRSIPYHYSKFWQTPAEVNFAQASDCKGKAVSLYQRMRSSGATNLRLVIGKRHLYDSATHAWLNWETSAGTFVLDPTFTETPIREAELDLMTYIPFYAYDGLKKYTVGHTRVSPTTRVATGAGYPSPLVPTASNTHLPNRDAARQAEPRTPAVAPIERSGFRRLNR